MADDRFEAREGGFRPLGAWTLLFRGFQVALDWKKLVLAAGGILTMAFSWWLLAVIFGGRDGDKPTWPSDYESRYGGDRAAAWTAFRTDRGQWNLRYEAAGDPDTEHYLDAGDLATSPEEYAFLLPFVDDAIKRSRLNSGLPERVMIYREEKRKDPDGKEVVVRTDLKPHVRDDRAVHVYRKAAGRLRVWPWFEDRGPNPYLMVTGQAGRADADGTPRYAPWDRGKFFDWFTTRQLPVLLEPVAKFARPVVYLLQPNPGFRNFTYFLLVTLATLATWALFGGAITRMAAVQIARKEKIGLGEAFRFARGQWKSYLFAAVFPLVVVAFLVLCCVLFWLIAMIPYGPGDLLGGLLWPLIFLAGVVMAAVLVGYLVGWPLIQATISTEGSDSFDALSRTYSYVFQSPWNYLGYAAVALAYGAVVVFFVGFMGSLAVYLGKWGASQTPGSSWSNREPSYLFVYAPTSFGWRELLLQGATTDDAKPVVVHGEIQRQAYDEYLRSFKWYNYIGAFFVTVWTYLVFLMVIGFGYSYFWSASTIIYLLMRHKVDDTDLDEVYLEEEEAEDIYTPPPMETAPPKPGTTPLAMVEPPALRPTAPAPAPKGTTDENVPGGSGAANP